MNTAEETAQSEKNIVLHGFNLELPPAFHEKARVKYQEEHNRQKALLALTSSTARRRSRELSYRGFLRDFIYQKIESGEWQI